MKCFLSFTDPRTIKIEEADIDDPFVYVEIDKLKTYSIEHLKKWLIYLGDNLHNIDTLKSAQIRVLKYFENKTINDLVDPTAKKIWLRKKADLIGVILSPFWKDGVLPSVPDILADQHKSPDIEMCGWTKSLDGMPEFTGEKIKCYHEKITNLFCEKSTAIKKHFIRGEQFIEEKLLDIASIYVKTNDKYFCINDVSAASLKRANRWMLLAIPAGKAGT